MCNLSPRGKHKAASTDRAPDISPSGSCACFSIDLLSIYCLVSPLLDHSTLEFCEND